ncbi:MAG: hypothetical protein Q8876_01095 [Bacillota bacterium]|nr:hypothetical protein [Bacillota bacterium]
MPKIHIERKTIHDIVIDPDHAKRVETSIFRKAKERLKDDGHYKCFICGAIENLQVHHFAVEYMFEELADIEKVKSFVEEFDPYGYGRLLKNVALTSIEDVRCLLVLCENHHVGDDNEDGDGGTGIHNLTFPTWIIQKLCRDGCNPVPQKGVTAEQTEAAVKANE